MTQSSPLTCSNTVSSGANIVDVGAIKLTWKRTSRSIGEKHFYDLTDDIRAETV